MNLRLIAVFPLNEKIKVSPSLFHPAFIYRFTKLEYMTMYQTIVYYET